MMNEQEILQFIDRNKEAVKKHPVPYIHKNEFRKNRLVSGGIARTVGGRLWATFIQCGETKYAHGVVIYSDDDGLTWCDGGFSNEQGYTDDYLTYCSVCSNLWTAPDGRLFWIYDYSLGFFDGIAGVWLAICNNPDDAQPEWSIPYRIGDGHAVNKPAVMSDGTWILPLTLWLYPTDDMFNDFFPCICGHELDAQRAIHILASTNQGQSWQQRGSVAVPRELWSFYEPNVVERRDHGLMMYLRTSQGISETCSTDHGLTWSVPETSKLRNPPARIFVEKLRSGRWLMVKHPIPDNNEGELKRNALIACLSDDDGVSWHSELVIDERVGVSYPDGFQDGDGNIYVAYDRIRTDGEFLFARFTEDDVLAGKYLSPGSRQKQLIYRLPGCEAVCDRDFKQVQIINNQ